MAPIDTHKAEGTPFDKLTIDTVEHIFLKGCEMDNFRSDFEISVGQDYYDGPAPRRLKPFALTVRGVCSKWKRMIDSEENFSLRRYWISRLVLAIPSYSKVIKSEGDGDDTLKYVPFARQMAQFRSQLTKSRGCDLDILLVSSDKLLNWDGSMDFYSETGIMLKLMAYALVILKKYSSQIVEIKIESNEPHLIFSAFALLSTIPRWDSRLSKMEIISSAAPQAVEAGLRTKVESILFGSGDLSRATTRHNISHLINLGEIIVSDGSWLAENLPLPINTESIHFWPQPHRKGMPWLKDFKRCQLHLLPNLITLKINDNAIYTGDVDPKLTEWKSASEGPLVFPMLQTLEVDSRDFAGADFLRHSSFPKLEIAELNLTSGKDNMTTQIDEASLPPTLPLSDLVLFNFTFPYSWTALTALRAFIPCSMQFEDVRISDLTEDGLQFSSEFVTSLRGTLAMLQPVKLELHMNDYHSTLFLLEAVDLNLLRILDIECSGEDKNPIQAHVKIEPNMPNINYANLTHLTINFYLPRSCIHFLTHISANNLLHLELELVVTGRSPKIMSPEVCVRSLCGALISHDAERGNVKFPNLSSSQFRLEYEKPLDGDSSQILVIKRYIHGMIKRRTELGAIDMVLKEAIQIKHKDRYDEPVFECQFELVKKVSKV